MTVLASDSGVGSDANPIGGNWTTLHVMQPLRRVSNSIRASANGSDNGARNTGATWPNDQYSKFAAGSFTREFGPVTRAATAAQTFYLTQQGYPGATDCSLLRVVSGTWTTLATTTRSHTNGDVYESRAIGTTISAWVNGSQALSTTDANIASGQTGIYAVDSNMPITNWEGGDFASGAASLPPRRAFPQSILLR